MTENAPRFDLSGQAVGIVTAVQAQHAKRQAKRQRGQVRRKQSQPKEPIQSSAAIRLWSRSLIKNHSCSVPSCPITCKVLAAALKSCKWPVSST
ncbi:ProQ/FINO family protein [Pseudomonas sp. NPDC077186]|uniref:ProQ/FINO family protein n=1 Tax=Pseudomonas sp. NPDC077186 TaxID=3364421 RepID=UPI0037C8BFB8